ncbi:MAG: alpha/beta hydrolase [Gammaproteobacteria bacterium]
MLRVTLLCALLVLGSAGVLVSCSSGQLWVVNTLARNGDYLVQADIPYGTDPRQRLDLYQPAASVPSARMTLVFVPGGCWGACDTFPKDDYRFIADTFTAHGYTVVIPNYRLFPAYGFADIIADVAAAVDLIYRAAGRGAGYRQSASGAERTFGGGQMVALLALDERYLQPDTRQQLTGWIGLAGPYDFLPFTEDYQPALFAPESRYPDSQPVNFVDGGEPPALLLYGRDDVRVKPRNILSLSARLQAQGVPHQALCYDGIDHAGGSLALSRPLRDTRPVLADMLRFLQQLEQGPPDTRLAEVSCRQ